MGQEVKVKEMTVAARDTRSKGYFTSTYALPLPEHPALIMVGVCRAVGGSGGSLGEAGVCLWQQRWRTPVL